MKMKIFDLVSNDDSHSIKACDLENKMKIKIKRLREGAKIPAKGTEDAAGYDLFSCADGFIGGSEVARIPTGIALEIPNGYCGVVYSRSSTVCKGLIITPLLIDSDYRGEIFIVVSRPFFGAEKYEIKKGDRIAQLRIEKVEAIDFEEVKTLSETSRGVGAFGSTGR